MSRQQWLSILGVWVMIFSFLGFSQTWKEIIGIITGLLIIFISFKIRSINKMHLSRNDSNNVYVENGND